ncbi:MAG TPA: hypothetical protein VFS29_10405, partial [Motilibacteraceae bacterium]|nr:hypothetical protein [Motilibacteraceae bacterium]
LDADGVAVAERLALGGDESQGRAAAGRPLQVAALRGGEVVHAPTLSEVRDFHARVRAELPAAALEVADGDPALVAAFAEAPTSAGGTR